ncbi:hypothetical protein LSI54_04350 [Nesterenkonia sp. AY15]|uniref:hypothetical protein n=1 Tax=Nesterenkonia sp. YGD6 TaxID=2901231 RepID=UPI001F4CCF54|nr:hypothetical protein [Nesterenkonia sp. YGD6]MCH8562753.1 hypothetical protein [Nesterenkonia sp. YGD6]MCH8570594.1 hypothetical protein [Nesterenkonia sp. AY15]
MSTVSFAVTLDASNTTDLPGMMGAEVGGEGQIAIEPIRDHRLETTHQLELLGLQVIDASPSRAFSFFTSASASAKNEASIGLIRDRPGVNSITTSSQ